MISHCSIHDEYPAVSRLHIISSLFNDLIKSPIAVTMPKDSICNGTIAHCSHNA
jgi:hypothetical protein